MLRHSQRILFVLVFTLLFSARIFAYGSEITQVVSDTPQSPGPSGINQGERGFTVVVIPDTQYEISKYPQMWKTMVQWILDNASSQNIKAVIGVGDITDTHTASEFKTAQEGFNLIGKASIPYVPVIGNHDYDNITKRVAATYDAYFGPNQLSDKPWYGNGYPKGSNQNYYIKFDAGTHKYLVIVLEFFPRAAALAWAQGIVDANTDREVIVVTHAYLNNNAERQVDSGDLGPLAYKLADYNNGQKMWDKFIKVNKNIIMTLNGHFVGYLTTARKTSTGTYGNFVHQMFVNYQSQNSGDGYMMLLKFQPDSGKIQVSFYSATLEAYDPKDASYDLTYLHSAQAFQSSNASDACINPEIIFSGPHQKVSPEMSADLGFSSFASSVSNVISRSGQPTIIGFQWLKGHGWKGVVDLRVNGESGPISDDTNIPGFNELHFNYLALPITDGSVPSDQQAQKFLKFVTNPLNQTIHVHCRAGVGRTGVMIALYRYMVQGWPIDKAISESRLFSGGVNDVQKNWLERWAQTHKPGSYRKPIKKRIRK